MKLFKKTIFILTCLSQCPFLFAQLKDVTIQKNVVYGMVSGAALLMDIYQPPAPNHMGIVAIPGSAYGNVYEDDYGQEELKSDFFLDSNYFGKWAQALVQKGYTIFVINHRFAPGFHVPEIIADCRRAVRFIRYHASQYKIDPEKIGAFGHSSGAALAAILGVSDTAIVGSDDPVEKMHSKVQAVVALAGIFDLSDFNKKEDSAMKTEEDLEMMKAAMGALPEMQNDTFILSGKYKTVSAIAQVGKDDAPMLLYYADNDPIVPPRQSVRMYLALLEQHIPAKLILSKGTGHAPLPDMDEVSHWFQLYLNDMSP